MPSSRQTANRTGGVPCFTFPAEDAVDCPTCMAPTGEACRNTNDGGVAGAPCPARQLAHRPWFGRRRGVAR